MVAKIMKEYARILGSKFPDPNENYDPEEWEICGLIHDWDYQFDPEGHPFKHIDKLETLGYSEQVRQAILGHAPRLGLQRNTKMAQTLLAVDELAGLLFAYSKMKGGYGSMDVKGVLKKFKDKSFAAKVNRDDISLGVTELGIPLEEHIQNVLKIISV